MKAFSINIISLSLKAHSFDFRLGDGFFKEYGADLVSGGDFTAEVILTKHETFIDAAFQIRGHAHLVCDRSLEPFEQAIDIDKRMVFKYGEEEAEVSDEIVVISPERSSLDLGQYMYEFIVLEIPMKRLHPKFRDNEDDDDNTGKLVYSSFSDEDPGEKPADPRWEQLKKLK